jgi:hypothetical protein
MARSNYGKGLSQNPTRNEKIGLLADDFLLNYPYASKASIVQLLHKLDKQTIDSMFINIHEATDSLAFEEKKVRLQQFPDLIASDQEKFLIVANQFLKDADNAYYNNAAPITDDAHTI